MQAIERVNQRVESAGTVVVARTATDRARCGAVAQWPSCNREVSLQAMTVMIDKCTAPVPVTVEPASRHSDAVFRTV